VDKKGLLLTWLFLAIMAAGAVRAEMVRNLHAATVPVADQGSKALAAASREALAEVLVKVTGSQQVLRNPAITEALAQARGNVQQYAYVRGQPPERPLLVTVEFDSAYVTDLVRRAGAPLWTANRPVVLAWVVVEGEAGRYFINRDNSPEQAQLLLDEFARRGVPVQIPVFDLADMGALGTEEAWRLDANAIVSASARYDVEDVLAGRLANLSNGESVGDWSYFHGGERTNRSATVPDLQSFLRTGVSMVADEMAARYAMLPSAGGEGEMRMVVLGVSSYADYAAIVRFLEDLELVESANIQRIRGRRIELVLQTAVDATQLATLIELNSRLSPLPATGSNAQLNYQWLN